MLIILIWLILFQSVSWWNGSIVPSPNTPIGGGQGRLPSGSRGRLANNSYFAKFVSV